MLTYRLCVLLFNELKRYQFPKSTMIWQKECAEIVTIYENLLSRYANDNGKYKIIQRIRILLQDYYRDNISDYEKNLKRLFN